MNHYIHIVMDQMVMVQINVNAISPRKKATINNNHTPPIQQHHHPQTHTHIQIM